MAMSELMVKQLELLHGAEGAKQGLEDQIGAGELDNSDGFWDASMARYESWIKRDRMILDFIRTIERIEYSRS